MPIKRSGDVRLASVLLPAAVLLGVRIRVACEVSTAHRFLDATVLLVEFTDSRRGRPSFQRHPNGSLNPPRHLWRLFVVQQTKQSP